MVRGVRGAITVNKNNSIEILNGTKLLLENILEANNINKDSIASIFFSVTPDLNAEFPAKAARELSLTEVPLMCFKEIDVPKSLKMCIRILLLFNTELNLKDIKHIYLKEAKLLRPDIIS